MLRRRRARRPRTRRRRAGPRARRRRAGPLRAWRRRPGARRRRAGPLRAWRRRRWRAALAGHGVWHRVRERHHLAPRRLAAAVLLQPPLLDDDGDGGPGGRLGGGLGLRGDLGLDADVDLHRLRLRRRPHLDDDDANDDLASGLAPDALAELLRAEASPDDHLLALVLDLLDAMLTSQAVEDLVDLLFAAAALHVNRDHEYSHCDQSLPVIEQGSKLGREKAG
jgi:hypothetical protein